MVTAKRNSVKTRRRPLLLLDSYPKRSVNFDTRQVQTGVGYVMIFLALKNPTHTNYSKARVLGGGILAEILGTHPTGAMVRVMGDMRGRTVEIRFSKNPIPLD